MKPIDVLATSWSCHFKKRCLVDPLYRLLKFLYQKSKIKSKKYFRIKFISCVSKSVQNLNLTSSQKVMRVMNVRSIKLKFTLDAVVVMIMFWVNFMNEQTQNNRQRNSFLKIFILNPKSYSFKVIRKTLYLGSVHASKINTKSISNRGTFCNFSLAPKGKIYTTSKKHFKYINSLLKT